ncbi:uncharacterized protein LOC113581021 isoform X2 [Electrophorus electricus]|uniref:uncharacterized protein LOC113581021 isoform X2 n=1 Tax=Electrophorus electricus TaxID=8005 RepID=UPI0015CFCBBC|nr:uncharacterized protein LOC113581021 isoform X2 [Electrophorus electricus]
MVFLEWLHCLSHLYDGEELWCEHRIKSFDNTPMTAKIALQVKYSSPCKINHSKACVFWPAAEKEELTKAKMSSFQKFLLLVIAGVIITTSITVAVFIFINFCIKKKAKFKIRSESNSYTNRSNIQSTLKSPEAKAPPLPSRDQFLSEDSDSHNYEDMDTLPDCLKVEEETKCLQQTPNFHSPNTWKNSQDEISTSEDYDDIDKPDHGAFKSHEDLTSLPDYVDLEDDTPVFPLQSLPLADNAKCEDSQSASDSYDDIDQLESAGEDYDEVG